MLHTRDNSFPSSSTGGPASYETPALADLQRLIWFRGGSDNHVDQVWPNIYLGDAQKSLKNPSQTGANCEKHYLSWKLCSQAADEITVVFRVKRRGGRIRIQVEEDPNELCRTDFGIPNPNLLSRWAARSITTIQSLNITHILNAADGPYSINTGAKYYKDLQIEYFGIEAFDDPSFDLSIFFYDAANFIGKALNTSGGKVFVHCAMGVSRSATLVLAFLMIHENMTLVDALKTVGSHRDICPNTGFLSQLRELDIKLSEERKGIRAPASKAL